MEMGLVQIKMIRKKWQDVVLVQKYKSWEGVEETYSVPFIYCLIVVHLLPRPVSGHLHMLPVRFCSRIAVPSVGVSVISLPVPHIGSSCFDRVVRYKQPDAV